MRKRILLPIVVAMALLILWPFALAEGWVCPECGAENGESVFCENCGLRRPEEGVWSCAECGTLNVGSDRVCSWCGAAKPQGGKPWVCLTCGEGNDGASGFCAACGTMKDSWRCAMCQTLNEKGAAFCIQCGAAREQEKAPETETPMPTAEPQNNAPTVETQNNAPTPGANLKTGAAGSTPSPAPEETPLQRPFLDEMMPATVEYTKAPRAAETPTVAAMPEPEGPETPGDEQAFEESETPGSEPAPERTETPGDEQAPEEPETPGDEPAPASTRVSLLRGAAVSRQSRIVEAEVSHPAVYTFGALPKRPELSPENLSPAQPTLYSNPRFLDEGRNPYDAGEALSAGTILKNRSRRAYGIYMKFTPGRRDSGYVIRRVDLVVSDPSGEAVYREGFDTDILCRYGEFWYWNFLSLDALFEERITAAGAVPTGKYTVDLYFDGGWAGRTAFSVGP